MMSIFSTYVTNSAYKDRYGSLFITCIVVTGPELILMPKLSSVPFKGVKSYLTSNALVVYLRLAAFAQFFTETHLSLMFDTETSTFVNMIYIDSSQC